MRAGLDHLYRDGALMPRCRCTLILPPRTLWLGDIRWPFPTWAIRARPFDWRIDA